MAKIKYYKFKGATPCRTFKTIEFDPYSVVPSVAVQSNGMQTDKRLVQTGDDRPILYRDIVDLSRSFRSMVSNLQSASAYVREKTQNQVESPSPENEPKTE